MTNRKRHYRRRKALQAASRNLKEVLQVRNMIRNMIRMSYDDHRLLEEERKLDDAILRYEKACNAVGVDPDYDSFIDEAEEVEVSGKLDSAVRNVGG